jgi:S-DNA-T family DNA segregation ATPase FtsK/SpoIIIE
MKILSSARLPRLRELLGVLLLLGSVGFVLALASYHANDPSWNTASAVLPVKNRIGPFGAHLSDLVFQVFGIAGWLLPLLMATLGWKWFRDHAVGTPWIRLTGCALLVGGVATLLELALPWNPYGGSFQRGGIAGFLFASILTRVLNPIGAGLFILAVLIVALYLVSTFSLARFTGSMDAWWEKNRPRFRRRVRLESEQAAVEPTRRGRRALATLEASSDYAPIVPDVAQPEPALMQEDLVEQAAAAPQSAPWSLDDIPIRELEIREAPAEVSSPVEPRKKKKSEPVRATYKLPPSYLLTPVPEREGFDSQELKDVAGRIKTKLEEFNVLGNIVQINPGPVVTTFEFKPDAGVKIAKITTLSEDLCLGLQAESILIERIPGKPTVGIEVPNTRREQISLRQILESEEFSEAQSRLTFAMGKDISGRIRIAELEKMPHLLIAGSTGSGKSVMLNTLIMSVLYKSTPDEVRMIMVDPKRVELGIYEGIPHLLTPVITDPKKATNALRNAVIEMERRLKLLASYGVRNIDQFNRKIRQMQEKPLELFPAPGEEAEPLERPLPYILVIIDELADLMMLERAGVEESVIRLAQMARAVGMHLVLATQRPSVDVITGLIKANFPARVSFRVATRVDSRTVLDVMGAEHLLGKGDMLFLPPGTSRLVRVHGAYVSEAEINSVVDHWKEQAQPDYDRTFLLAPPSEDDENGEVEEFDGDEDPLYQDAVRVILEMGKASTSILQRRLRLGYGRAARILDMMQHEGIIGPPDGSRPREVLKRPDWLDEVESTLR